MRIHHLDCGSMCPVGGNLVFGPPNSDVPRTFVCHCLLIETQQGLVLVDSGLGLDDVRGGMGRLGAAFMASCRARLLESECAVRQVEALGFSASDVRHIVLTHMDLDHAGGVMDFPDATVHVYRPEHAAALGRWQPRYIKSQFADARFSLYDTSGEDWFGFDCVRELEGLPPEVLIVPMVGHSPGHAAVAVQRDDGWILHCGDAYFHRAEARPEEGPVPPGLKLFQAVIQHDGGARKRNQARLRQLAADHKPDVTLFCAHDSVEFGRSRAR